MVRVTFLSVPTVARKPVSNWSGILIAALKLLKLNLISSNFLRNRMNIHKWKPIFSGMMTSFQCSKCGTSFKTMKLCRFIAQSYQDVKSWNDDTLFQYPHDYYLVYFRLILLSTSSYLPLCFLIIGPIFNELHDLRLASFASVTWCRIKCKGSMIKWYDYYKMLYAFFSQIPSVWFKFSY